MSTAEAYFQCLFRVVSSTETKKGGGKMQFPKSCPFPWKFVKIAIKSRRNKDKKSYSHFFFYLKFVSFSFCKFWKEVILMLLHCPPRSLPCNSTGDASKHIASSNDIRVFFTPNKILQVNFLFLKNYRVTRNIWKTGF